MKIEDKLFLDGIKPDESQSHLKIVDQAVCLQRCGERGRPCTLVCPAKVYTWEENKTVVAYNNCLECGACRIYCPFGNIDWDYPRGGFGISYKQG